ncbi:MAG TPA: leucyl/phenylalanyl-tRNA--protein transferase [Chitinophagaceae bacterium]|nr:leucyl/phenylalanyl-tRNA--protein transferase [Chitinophagaceae bacterium]
MPVFALDQSLNFPPVHLAEPDGLLAVGGDLSPERLLLAYRRGIFPWYEGKRVLWWCPDPRFVLFPSELKIGKTARKILGRSDFEFAVNRDFRRVIRHCRHIPRAGQTGTWITPEMEAAYLRMHELGYAHSAETWKLGKLVGGLYGIRLGKVFFGESMFSLISNGSRIAMIRYVEQLRTEGVELIDCQVYTPYVESFGARMIRRAEFLRLLARLIPGS